MYADYATLFLLFRILAFVQGILCFGQSLRIKNNEVLFKSNWGSNHPEIFSFSTSNFRQLKLDGNDIKMHKRNFFATSWTEKNTSEYLKTEYEFDNPKIWSYPSPARFQQWYVGQERRLADFGPTRRLVGQESYTRSRLLSASRNAHELRDTTRRNSENRRETNFRLDSMVKRIGEQRLQQNRGIGEDRMRQERRIGEERLRRNRGIGQARLRQNKRIREERLRQNRRIGEKSLRQNTRNIKTYAEIIRKDVTGTVLRDNPTNRMIIENRLEGTRKLQVNQLRVTRRIIRSKMNPSRRVRNSVVSEVADTERKFITRRNSSSFRRRRFMKLKSMAMDGLNVHASSRNQNRDDSHRLQNRQRILRAIEAESKSRRHATSHLQTKTDVVIFNVSSSLQRHENMGFCRHTDTKDTRKGSKEKCFPQEKYGIQQIRSSSRSRSISLLEARKRISSHERFDQRSRLHAERVQLRQGSRIDERVVASTLKVNQNVRRDDRFSSERARILRVNERMVIGKFEAPTFGTRRVNIKGARGTERDWWWGKSMPKSLDSIVVSLLLLCELHAVVKETNTKKMANVGSVIGFLFRTKA